jgi:hypothetical protein
MPPKKRPTRAKRTAPHTKPSRKTATKPPRTRPVQSSANHDHDPLAEHNRLRALMGLPAVEREIVANPALSEANKLQSLAGKTNALAIMDAMYAGEGPVPPTGTIICWWGQFSRELPPPFTLTQGGHGFAEAADLEQTTIAFAQLRNWVRAHETASGSNLKLRETREWAGISSAGQAWYRWMLADERQMTVLFKKPSQLTKAERRVRIKV